MDEQRINHVKRENRRHICTGIARILVSVFVVCILLLSFLTIQDMRAQSNPIVYQVEDGVYNLTAADLEAAALDIGNYVLYTNNCQIKVSIPTNDIADGELLLWDAAHSSKPILYGTIDSRTNTCTFTGLSAANRYKLTYCGTENIIITVSEGRTVSFWNSLKNVLYQIIGMI